MSKIFELTNNPELPEEIKQAALNGELVLFVGAGLSISLGLPSWSEFADKVLEELRSKEFLDYSEVDELKVLDPRKQLSIADTIAEENEYRIKYKDHLKPDPSSGEGIYKALNDIGCPCVTTNYDELLVPRYKGVETKDGSVTPASVNRISEPERFFAHLLDEPGTVIHLHGCSSKPETMIVTTKDYLEQYDHENVQAFLERLFKKKVVLFLGYGLEEAEILEHILRRGQVLRKGDRRRFSLEGFFLKQEPFYKKLYKYYEISFGVHLIGFNRDRKDYKALESIVESWAGQLEIRKPSLAEDVDFMNEVLASG